MSRVPIACYFCGASVETVAVEHALGLPRFQRGEPIPEQQLKRSELAAMAGRIQCCSADSIDTLARITAEGVL